MSSEEKFLSDYTPSLYQIDSCELDFSIHDGYTIVKNTLVLQKNEDIAWDLFLHGKELELIEIILDGTLLSSDQYNLSDEGITLSGVTDKSTLSITTKIYPEKNTELEGLYFASGIYCTQNEPEGFRKITYFLDRPDVMTVYTTKITASKKFPILLSNGNLIDSGDLEDDRHFAKWHDPFKKPSYLFALVAGDLGKISDTFTTMSGRVVDLHIFSDHGNEMKCLHAMESLKKSMQWDEDTYGREYDLDVFHIVALDSFNMGAMENKSLNIFNTIYVLADTETATDKDFLGIESVIGHEYFHNWTGNRITCRDWFQLTLKEGLTVFRDHDFSGDMNSRATMRIEDIRDLREFQFWEDAGPTAHPIQPASYKEMNNFYTATVYEKGSEVIRMMATLLGKEKFRKAMDLYFDTFDGQAVRTQDFVWAMQTAGGMDLTQFEETWYHQERTPGLRVHGVFDPKNETYTLECEQVIEKNTRGGAQKPFFYPLGIALFRPDGSQYPLIIESNTEQSRLDDGLLIISKKTESFVFTGIQAEPKTSLNRGFSAPIRVWCDATDSTFLMQHETDGFARYEAANRYTLSVIFDLLVGNPLPEAYFEAFESLLTPSEDLLYSSLLLKLPSLNEIASEFSGSLDFEKLSLARKTLQKGIFAHHSEKIHALYDATFASLSPDEAISITEIGKRALLGSLLGLLSVSDDRADIQKIAEKQYTYTKTMTLKLSAMNLLYGISPRTIHPFLEKFRTQYEKNPLVIMKYLSMVGGLDEVSVFTAVTETQAAPYYEKTLPNHAKALFGAFSRNLEFFHQKDGSGYQLLTDFILSIDAINPHTAARMATAFKLYPRLTPEIQTVMKPFLEKILKHEGLSKNTEEIIEKILISTRF